MKQVLILSTSPRRDGNSAKLAMSAAKGIEDAGNRAEVLYADDFIGHLLRDCRECRRDNGTCSIEDTFSTLFLDHYLRADGFIAATPIYWYGVSAQLKAFFDRMFCFVAASYPGSQTVVQSMGGKRIGLLLTSEESFPTVSAAPVHQIQEYARYTNSTFVGVVHGYGNSRLDIARDPSAPIDRARSFGRSFLDARATDYRIDTPRSASVW